MDGVNRDKELEAEFHAYRHSEKGDSIRMEAIWDVWLNLKRNDLRLIRIKNMKIIISCVQLAEMHFKLAPHEIPYLEYVKWFISNRLLNTGSDEMAKCQKNPIFVDPEYKPTRRKFAV
tara:strand:+ start:3796 stop:4149 length:354 start_codon:yes stop_codon:yes gene_type:complete